MEGRCITGRLVFATLTADLMNTRRTDSHLDAAEDDAIERETNSFVEEGLRRGRPAPTEAVIDHKPGMERRTKVMFALGALGIVAILAAIASLRGGGDPPQALSPDLAALQQEAAAAAALPQQAPPPADPQPLPEALAADVPAEPAATEPPLGAAPVEAAVALAAPVPVSTGAEPAPATAGGPTPVEEVAATTEPPAPAADPAVVVQAQAEIARLRAELEAARAAPRPAPAVAPSRFQVVEVLEDGVVLQDGRGGTLIVPSGTTITATGNRLQESTR